MAASTIRKRPANSRRNKSGDTADRIDRRNKVLALRARGLSFREIAKLVGVSHVVCWRDFITLADGEETALTTELAKEQLLAAHAELIGKLMQDLDTQAQQGQIEELRGPDGQVLNAKVKRWISPQTAAEAGRALQRVAVLMGLTEVNPDQAAAATSTTSITLISPGSAAEFGQRAQELAAARQTTAIDVSVAQEPPSAPPQQYTDTSGIVCDTDNSSVAAAEPHRPLQDASGPYQEQPEPPLTGWRLSRARRLAREAATDRPSVRFLDPPQRN